MGNMDIGQYRTPHPPPPISLLNPGYTVPCNSFPWIFAADVECMASDFGNTASWSSPVIFHVVSPCCLAPRSFLSSDYGFTLNSLPTAMSALELAPSTHIINPEDGNFIVCQNVWKPALYVAYSRKLKTYSVIVVDTVVIIIIIMLSVSGQVAWYGFVLTLLWTSNASYP